MWKTLLSARKTKDGHCHPSLGVTLVLIEADESVVPLGNTAEHMSGLFYIQEASSMMPVSALFMNDESYDAVLDTAAAPGSKPHRSPH